MAHFWKGSDQPGAYSPVTLKKMELVVLSTSDPIHVLLQFSSPLPSPSAVTVTVKFTAVELSTTCTVSLEPFQKHCTGLSGELPLMITVVPTDSVVTCGSSRTGGGQSCATIPAQGMWQKARVILWQSFSRACFLTCAYVQH